MTGYVLSVNGEKRSVDLPDPDEPLLYILRNDLDLKGTRFGCGLGQCGACTVMLDGDAVPSCQIPVASAVGRAIVTIEGLGSPEKPHAVQAAFIARQAAQCGYCASGMVVASAALLAKTPRPDRAAVQEALAGNLCRCGTHDRILAAVLQAARSAAP